MTRKITNPFKISSKIKHVTENHSDYLLWFLTKTTIDFEKDADNKITPLRETS